MHFKFTTKYLSYFFKYVPQVTLFFHVLTDVSCWEKARVSADALCGNMMVIAVLACIYSSHLHKNRFFILKNEQNSDMQTQNMTKSANIKYVRKK